MQFAANREMALRHLAQKNESSVPSSDLLIDARQVG